MSPQETLMADQRVLQRVAAEYAAEGYAVQVRPKPKELPKALRAFAVDLVLRRGDETRAVQLCGLGPERSEAEWTALTEAARKAGWRLALRLISEEALAEPLPTQQVAERLTTARHLLEDGLVEAALIVSWSAAEAVLRHMAVHAELDPSGWHPSRLLGELSALDVLTTGEFQLLDRLCELRSVVAHGREPRIPVAADDVHSLIALADWYREHPGATAYEIAEQIHQEAPAPAMDANGLLDKRFPGLPALTRDGVLALLPRGMQNRV